ncbi:ABC transporter permease [Mesorhizobium sp. M0659]
MLLLSVCVFVVLRLLPSDPLSMMIPPTATAADVENIRTALGFNRPIPVQYLTWLQAALHGDLGQSIALKAGVSQLALNALPATVELALTALVLSIAISLPLAVLYFRARAWRAIALSLDVLFDFMMSVPAFLWAIALILIFGVFFNLLPTAGRYGSEFTAPGPTGLVLLDFLVHADWPGLRDAMSHLVLPASALALGFTPLVVRVIRGALIEVDTAPFAETARQRGYSESRVIWRHLLPNAAPATIAIIGTQFGFLLGATVLVESLFSLPGLGNLMVQAVKNNDLPLVQGLAIVFCAFTLVINVLADVALVIFNPKARTQ